jgi:hypothetical protein
MTAMDPAAISPTSSPATARRRRRAVPVTLWMFFFMSFWATCFCRSAEGLAINAILVVYYTAMIYILLLQKKMPWRLMLAATGMTILSVVNAITVLQSDRRDLFDNACFAFTCAVVAILVDRHHHIGPEDAQRQDASDLV